MGWDWRLENNSTNAEIISTSRETITIKVMQVQTAVSEKSYDQSDMRYNKILAQQWRCCDEKRQPNRNQLPTTLLTLISLSFQINEIRAEQAENNSSPRQTTVSVNRTTSIIQHTTESKVINQLALYDNSANIRAKHQTNNELVGYGEQSSIVMRKESTKPKSSSNNGQVFKPGAVSLRKFRILEKWDGDDKVLLECAESLLEDSGRWYHPLFHPEKQEFSRDLRNV